MTDQPTPPDSAGAALAEMLRIQSEAAMEVFDRVVDSLAAQDAAEPAGQAWAPMATRLQATWTELQQAWLDKAAAAPSFFSDPAKWLATAQTVVRQLPLDRPDVQKRLWEDGLALFETVLGQYGIGPKADAAGPANTELPRRDPRFAHPKWREQPLFALLHQSYLLLCDRLIGMAETLDGLRPAERQRLVFATRTLLDALSPAHFPLTNPEVLDRAIETRGESLARGLENLLADVKRGQLTHTDGAAFRLGENIAATPGKVVHETPLYQLIQYTPTTEHVLATPLVIFPPWINRFYILDLNPRKSFVRWALEQGISVFMVSWKSADDSMADLLWDDYVAAQIEAIDIVRERLQVASAHAMGYCVAGTTLAATLAVLARKGEAAKVRSATFLTAQVDFEDAGDLKHFIDEEHIEAIARLAPDGYLDGRYLAATFNLLRSQDLIWSYVVNHYLKGEDYSAFDLLYWNGDVTNLPAKWHRNYLIELYSDNRLVMPDSLRVGGVPIDLRRIATPCYVQASREDHIAPPHSVWKFTQSVSAPCTFVLAGSGHIAGVVNPPGSAKYQFWTHEEPTGSFDEFLTAAVERPGSWWPHWCAWLRSQSPDDVPSLGKRRPGGPGDPVVEDAPGRYVSLR